MVDSRPPIVLVGLDSLQGLQVARVFASRGLEVHAVAKDARYYTCRTRVVRSLTTCSTGSDALLDHLRALAPTLRSKPVLILCQDKSVAVVSRGRDVIEPLYHVMLPPPPVVDRLIDKAAFATYATSVGLPIPMTVVVTAPADAERAAAELDYPVIIKPSFRTSEWMKHTKTKAIKADSAEELLAHCARLEGRVTKLIVQEWIAGPETEQVTCNVYLDRTATTISGFVSRKIRQWPPLVGQGCLAELIHDEEVFGRTRDFFEAAGLVGFAYLEFKRGTDGRLLAIEPNIGRPTGRSAMAEAAGIEFHYTAYADAAGLPLPAPRGPDGARVKWIHLLRDLQAAAHGIWNRQLGLGECIQSIRGPKAFAVLSIRDPLPFLAALLGSLSELRSPRARGAT